VLGKKIIENLEASIASFRVIKMAQNVKREISDITVILPSYLSLS
jgi:hypothetical protein